jgi:thiosulfate dehydrogenase [quinone] large subunit
MMSSSAADAHEAPAGPTLADQPASSPVTLSEGSLIALALARIFFGLLWFQQIAWKMPPDFGGLRTDVLREIRYTILPGYSSIIQNVFLTHFSILGAFIWTAELLVGVSLLLGLFSRLGAALSLLLSMQLYVGIAYAPGEWYGAYGLLLMLSLVLVALPAGRRLGIDHILWNRFSQAAQTRRLARLVRHLL